MITLDTINFAEFGLPLFILKAIDKLGFKEPTAIQQKSLPAVIQGSDILGSAETGSGKTAAFLMPILSKLEANAGSQCLIVVPTRELALQIQDVARSLLHFHPGMVISVLIGGVPYFKQKQTLLRKPRLIIATPGRLLDHLENRILNLDKVNHFVLDEADRMFDMGFYPQIQTLLNYFEKKPQTLLFSATFPKEIKELASKILINPTEILIKNTDSTPRVISHEAMMLAFRDKNPVVLKLVNKAKGPTLVFTKTKMGAENLQIFFEQSGVQSLRIHGDRNQYQRDQAIKSFREGKARVLIATDIAARGIDIPDVERVINYDLPANPEDYVHRVGRTGRAGKKGMALTFVTHEKQGDWGYLMRRLKLQASVSSKNLK